MSTLKIEVIHSENEKENKYPELPFVTKEVCDYGVVYYLVSKDLEDKIMSTNITCGETYTSKLDMFNSLDEYFKANPTEKIVNATIVIEE